MIKMNFRYYKMNFHAPGLKGPPVASSNRIACPSVRPSLCVSVCVVVCP